MKAIALVGLSVVSLMSTGVVRADEKVPSSAFDAEVREASAEYFAVWFERCDVQRLKALTAPDIEFYHDKGGLSVGADSDVAMYAKRCPAAYVGKPKNPIGRRLTAGSQVIHPVPGFGAIEEGEHSFVRLEGPRAGTTASTARYVHVWKQTSTGWQLTRALGYAHEKVD